MDIILSRHRPNTRHTLPWQSPLLQHHWVLVVVDFTVIGINVPVVKGSLLGEKWTEMIQRILGLSLEQMPRPHLHLLTHLLSCG